MRFYSLAPSCLQIIKIEPYWNVNNDGGSSWCIEASIKIEPYWNVNAVTVKEALDASVIKIEPYWNVNY